MGNDFSKETRSTWDTADVEKWKLSAEVAQKSFYDLYAGAQFDTFESENFYLLRAKVCFAMFGLPQENRMDEIENLLHAYTQEQQEQSKKVLDKILEACGGNPEKATQNNLDFFTVFVMCKMNEKEFQLPVFRFRLSSQEDHRGMYLDTNMRVYKDWNDWKENNTLPMMKYCYPKWGYYTCHPYGEYAYNDKMSPFTEYGTSPACDLSERAKRTGDVVSTVGGLGSGGVMIIGMFTPLAPFLAVGAAGVGIASAVYGTARSVGRLVDKGTHGESLTDLESVASWITVALTPLSFATMVLNARLVNGAQNVGRIFSQTERTVATILNCTSFGLQSGMLAIGIANLVEKGKQDNLTTLDILQFSMSVFFFANTLVQPKTARAIIEKAQNQHIENYKNSMTDAQAQDTFKRFVEQNQGDGTILARSKIIRSINKIDNPNHFFKGAEKYDTIQIGGRRGRYMIVGNTDQALTRINPNFDPQWMVQMEKWFGANWKDTKINGKKLFITNRPHEMSRLVKSLKVAGRRANADIMRMAGLLSEDLGIKTTNDFACLIEIISVETQDIKQGNFATNLEYKNALSARLDQLSSVGRKDFVNGIRADLNSVKTLRPNLGYTFDSLLRAAEFPNCTHISVYLSDIPQQVFRSENLILVTEDNGIVIKEYRTADGTFGALAELPNGEMQIATIFPKEKFTSFTTRLLSRLCDSLSTTPERLTADIQSIATEVGMHRYYINVHHDGGFLNINNFIELLDDSE